MNSELLGAGLELYAILLAFYGGLFVVVQLGLERLPFSARSAYRVLFFGWALGTFFGNYAFYRFLGIMSFLPWLNNFLHTFVWIGLVLGWLYFASLNQPLWRRFVMFAAFSFAVKVAERQLLGSWDFPHFFGIYGSWAYILGWSLADGLYPILSDAGLKLIARMRQGFHAPQPS